MKFLQSKRMVKTILIVLLFAMTGTMNGFGQEPLTLTLNEPDEYSYNQVTNSYVPFYGQFSDDYQYYSQFIIPASDLESVQYGEIQTLSFYISKDPWGYGYPSIEMPNWSYYDDQFQIYFAEVGNETFEYNANWEYELYEESEMTLVFDGADYYNHYGQYGDYYNVYEEGDYYKIQFYLHFEYNYDTGTESYYHYNGGNLLVYVKPTQMNNPYECWWLGVNQDQGGYYKEGDGPAAIYFDGDYVYGQDFKPMMTIEYVGGEAPSCPAPQDFEATPYAHYATLNWSTDASMVNIQYKKSTDWEWSVEVENYEWYYSYNLFELESQTSYEVRVMAICDGDDVSDWSTISFTTTAPAAPTYLTASNYDTPDANTATLNWEADYNDTPDYWDIAFTTDMTASPNNSNIITIDASENYSSYTLSDLTPFATYKVWIRSNFGDGEVSDWSEPCSFKTTNWGNIIVNQGYSEHYLVPFYITQQYSTTSKSQFIITSDKLSELVSHEIKKLKFAPRNQFYGDETGIPTASVQVYLKEVVDSEFSSIAYYEWDEMELVYQGDFSQTKNDLEFDTPFYYSGGNLLVGVCATTEYNYNSYYNWNCWRGIAANNMSLYSIGSGNPARADFLPMITFYYAPNETSSITKHIVGYSDNMNRYYLISTPVGEVSPENVTDMLANTYDLYYFDQASDLEWINYKPNPNATNPDFNLVPGKGYLYANSENVTLYFGDTPYNGSGQITLHKTDNVSFSGWNLVGNPFAETAYITKPYYTMNANGSEIIAGTGAAIDPMEGIFVIAETDGETLTFNTEMPAKGSSQLVINLKDSFRNDVTDCAVLRFDDSKFLPKLQLFENNSKVYIPQFDGDYAIISVMEIGEMPLNFEAAENGRYTIGVDTKDVEMRYLHLVDNLTGADVDLLKQPSYSFDAKTTDYASRFRVVFAQGNTTDQDDFAFMRDEHLLVLGVDGVATLQIIDMAGRMISSEQFSGCYDQSFDAVPGVYVLRLIQGENVRIQKVVVR